MDNSRNPMDSSHNHMDSSRNHMDSPRNPTVNRRNHMASPRNSTVNLSRRSDSNNHTDNRNTTRARAMVDMFVGRIYDLLN